MGKVIILPDTTLDPITTMGRMAGVCWGAETDKRIANYQRGWECVKSGHGRVMEFVEVSMILDGYSARVMREWYTHIGGAPTRLQASTRYIDYANFEYITPNSIECNVSARDAFDACMEYIQNTLEILEHDGVPREDAAMLLPLGMTTRVVDKRNLRNLVDMSRQRMCNRAYWEFRELFKDICDALEEYGSDSGEWTTIVMTQMRPKCKVVGYCTEKHGCGMMPGREG
jgi:thymidylate synthase (FAD)